MIVLISFISGMIYSIGLCISGIINPEKVIGFLDIFGNWDFSIGLFFLGSIIFNYITFRFILRRGSIYNKEFSLPNNSLKVKKIILGSIIFGIGWGIIGICPGPALINLVTLKSEVFIFLGSIISGMVFYKILILKNKKA